MSAMSNYLENELTDHALGTGSWTMPASVYLALYSSSPTDADSGTEISGTGYARELITFGAASGGSASNDVAVTFTAGANDWGTVTHWGLRTASSGGNLLFHGAWNTPRPMTDGDDFVVSIGGLTITGD